MILSSNTLYGTAHTGGSAGLGTVFGVNTDGTGFTTLHSFTDRPGYSPIYGDGAFPEAGVILSGNSLYGATPYGGFCGGGTVFAVSTDGTDFTTLHCFTGSNGHYPNAVILSENTLYGTAWEGGIARYGSVFKVNTNGTGFTTLHSFTEAPCCPDINADGCCPFKGVILSGNRLYGMAVGGGTNGSGTVFGVNTDGTGFTTLHTFTATSGGPGGYSTGTNSDGGYPSGSLISSGNTLYGATRFGGSFGNGTLFTVSTDGTGFTTLRSFTVPSDISILSGNTLYGIAYSDGSSYGTVFAVKTDGTGFTTLYSFTATSGSGPSGSGPYTNSDGADPNRLLLSGNTLYGTAAGGGSGGAGTVFSLTLPPPQLNIIRSGANVILTWPTNAAGFTLQSTTNLGSSVAWSTVSPAPVVVNGENAVTNPISSTRKFYRLIQ